MTLVLNEIGHDPEIKTSHKPIKVLVTGYGPFLRDFPINSSWEIASSLPKFLPATASLPVDIQVIVPEKPLRVSYSHVASVAPKLLSGTYKTTSLSTLPISRPNADLFSSATLPKPDIVLHIGLAAGRKFFTLERQAQRGPFDALKDVDGHVFPKSELNKVFAGCPEILKPTLDTHDVWRRWRANVPNDKLDLRPSDDPGRYLCGFVFYFSMAWYFKKNRDEENAEDEDEDENEDAGRIHEEAQENNIKERPVAFLHVPDLPTREELDQGIEITIGLIKALVASRVKIGVVEPLDPKTSSSDSELDPPVIRSTWDGVRDFSNTD